MKKVAVFSILLVLLSVFLLCSCRSTKVEEKPVIIDYTEIVQPLFSCKPDEVVLIADVKTLSDVMQNSVAFQSAYEDWKGYAESLEKALLIIANR